MPWAAIGTAVAGAATSAVVGSMLAPDTPGGSGGAAAAADPFAAERAQYMPQLQALMSQNQNFGQSQAQTRLNEMMYGRPAQAARPAQERRLLSAGRPATEGRWEGQSANYQAPNPMLTDGDGGWAIGANGSAVPPGMYSIAQNGIGSQGTWVPGQAATQDVWQEATAATEAIPASNGFDSSDPSYKWRFDQGMEAVNRSAGAAGMLGSGNRMTALMNYGQGAASTEFAAQFGRLSNEAGRQYSQNSADYSNQFSRLSQLSGANSGQPGAAGQILASQNGQQLQAAGAVASTLGNAASSAFGSWMNGSGGGGGSNWNTGGGTANNPSAYVSDNSSIGYMPDTNNYSPVW